MDSLDPTFIDFIEVCKTYEYIGCYFPDRICFPEHFKEETPTYHYVHICLNNKQKGKVQCFTVCNDRLAGLIKGCIFQLSQYNRYTCDKYLSAYMDFLSSRYNTGDDLALGIRQFVKKNKSKNPPLRKCTERSSYITSLKYTPYVSDCYRDKIISQLHESNKSLRVHNRELINKSVEHEKTRNKNSHLKEVILKQSAKYMILRREKVAEESLKDVCVICLDKNLVPGQLLKVLSCGNHVMHQKCTEQISICPMCKE